MDGPGGSRPDCPVRYNRTYDRDAHVTTAVAFVFVLGVLIFVHELGHFIMARRIGVRVLTFSLGFGPKILSFRRGDTEYCISIIPLGGYVKMAGETPEDTRTGSSDEFLSKPKWQRFQVLVMGPIMNLAFAIIVMSFVLYQGAPIPAFEDQPAVIGGFGKESPAPAAGIEVGDRIVAVEGRELPTWKQVSLAIAMRAKRPTRLTIERAGKRFDREVTPVSADRFDTGELFLLPVMHPQIVALRDKEPAQEGGLHVGDVVFVAAGEQNPSRDQLIGHIKNHENKPLTLEIRRNGQMQTVTVTPRKIGTEIMVGATISTLELHTFEPGPVEAFKLSLKQNWEWTTLIFQTLGGLFTRETSVKQLMGPVAIADLSGAAAEQPSWIPIFQLMAMISLNLGLLNLMPIPVLDGGHIAILALEGISRRDFSMRVKEKMLLVGFVLILMLMVTVIYNDLMRIQWIERLVPWR
jgi:regulator of sigma E protease